MRPLPDRFVREMGRTFVLVIFLGGAGAELLSLLFAASLSLPVCSDSLYVSFCRLVLLNYDIISF